MTWYTVYLEGGAHLYELPDDEPPEVGQVRDLGGVKLKIDSIATGKDGKPVLTTTRIRE